MALIKVSGFWSGKWQKEFNVPKGYVLLKISDQYKKDLGALLSTLDNVQIKKEQLKELDLTFEIFYKKRTLKQNSLMWALYEIEANEQNGRMSGGVGQDVTTSDLYNADLVNYSPRVKIKVPPDLKNFYESNYYVEFCSPVLCKKGGDVSYYQMSLIEGTSHFNTVQMAKWIDRQFNRLAFNGVDCSSSGEIKKYWVDWRKFLNDKEIVIHDKMLSAREYRELNPICEATGKLIENESGHICHISARGMGGNQDEYLDCAWNLLHLDASVHIEQHTSDWKTFINKYPHLEYKILTALNED